jgi:hypothetical protein
LQPFKQQIQQVDLINKNYAYIKTYKHRKRYRHNQRYSGNRNFNL